jgi:hypothetical protein
LWLSKSVVLGGSSFKKRAQHQKEEPTQTWALFSLFFKYADASSKRAEGPAGGAPRPCKGPKALQEAKTLEHILFQVYLVNKKLMDFS